MYESDYCKLFRICTITSLLRYLKYVMIFVCLAVQINKQIMNNSQFFLHIFPKKFYFLY
jgi:hypothetical protein